MRDYKELLEDALVVLKDCGKMERRIERKQFVSWFDKWAEEVREAIKSKTLPDKKEVSASLAQDEPTFKGLERPFRVYHHPAEGEDGTDKESDSGNQEAPPPAA